MRPLIRVWPMWGLDEDSRSQVEELASVWHAEGRLSMSDFERFWDVLCATESRNVPSESRGKAPGRAFGLISLGASRASGHRWGSSQWPATTQYVNACLKRQYPQGIWTTLQVQPKGYGAWMRIVLIQVPKVPYLVLAPASAGIVARGKAQTCSALPL